MQYLNLPDKLIIKDYKFERDSPKYEEEVRSILKRIKTYFPQISFFTDNLQKDVYKSIQPNSEKAAIQSEPIFYKTTDFQVIPQGEDEIRKFVDQMQKYVQTPAILDILLRINFIYESYPALTNVLDDLLFSISTENRYPLIKLALISQLFTSPTRQVDEKIIEYDLIDMPYSGEIVSCAIDSKTGQVIPLSMNDEYFPVSDDSIYLRYYKHDYVFSPTSKTVSFCQSGRQNRKATTKSFKEFLSNDEEKVVDVGVFNDQLCVVQQNESKTKLRVSLFKKGILADDLSRREQAIDLNGEICEKCKIFQNNIEIFTENGFTFLYNIAKNLLVKSPPISQVFYDFSSVSVFDKSSDAFVLPASFNNEKLFVCQVVKRERKKSNFMQILPPFFGTKTDEIIARVSYELLNISTEVISDLIESKQNVESNLVSDPILHIQYALDLAESIRKNEFDHSQNLCDFCLVALTRFILINMYQLNAKQQKMADFMIRRVTRLFAQMKMSPPHFDTLFALISLIDHGIYTKEFIKNVLNPFIPLLDVKKILSTPSFVLYVVPENISSMSTKEKMSFLQSKINHFVGIYSEKHLDKELIPFVTTFFEVLEEALNSKTITNISVFSYLSSLIPILTIMQNTPQLSFVVLEYLMRNLERIFMKTNSLTCKILKYFDVDDDKLAHFNKTHSFELHLPKEWVEYQNNCIDQQIHPIILNEDHVVKINEVIPNEINNAFADLKKEDLLFFLLPNAIVNCIQICYDSIEITQQEKDNKCYLSYEIKQKNPSKEYQNTETEKKADMHLPKRASSNVVTTSNEENEFLSSLNESSCLIKRLRKEIRSLLSRNIFKEIELLIFRTLLFQARLIKYAMNVKETSEINQNIVFAWKTAIKVRADLHLAKQFEANKQEVHLDLKERYDDFIMSIKAKCSFLLENKINNDSSLFKTNDWIKQIYSFITSNLPLNALFTLQELDKKRGEIKEKSLSTINEMFKIKMPKSFMRSFISLLSQYKKITFEKEFLSLLMNSDDPFLRLCTFDFADFSSFVEIALTLIKKEDNQYITKFLNAIINSKEYDIDVDKMLELIGRSQYDIENRIQINFNNFVEKINEKISFKDLLTKLKGFDDISLGVSILIPTYSSKDVNLLLPIILQLQDKLPNPITSFKDKIIMNIYFTMLNSIIETDYKLCNQIILPKLNLGKYEEFINFNQNTSTKVDVLDLIELCHEIKDKNSTKSNDETPYFIQIKGNPNSIPEMKTNSFECSFEDLNFYVFSKPLQNNESIHFSINFQCQSYFLLGAVDISDGMILMAGDACFINNNFCFKRKDYYDLNNIYLAKFEEGYFEFFNVDNSKSENIYKRCSKGFFSGPIIPFILTLSDISFDYEYYPDFHITSNSFWNDIDTYEINDINKYMTVIPDFIIGNKIIIDNVGSGVVVKNNNKNDDGEIVLFDENGIPKLAELNLISKNCKIKEEKKFFLLLRSIIISGGCCNIEIIQNYLSLSLSEILSDTLFTFFLFNASSKCIQHMLDNFNEYLEKYKKSLVELINEHIVEFTEMNNDNSIFEYLLQNDLIDNPLRFLTLILRKIDDLSHFISIMKYKLIDYSKISIYEIKTTFYQIKKIDMTKYLESRNFFLYIKDIINYLLIHSRNVIVSHPFKKEFLGKFLVMDCNATEGIPLIAGLIYYQFVPSQTFVIAANKKFILSMGCTIDKEQNQFLEPNKEYQFNKNICLKICKPRIDDVFGLIREFNENPDCTNILSDFFSRSDELIFKQSDSVEGGDLSPQIYYIIHILFSYIKELKANIPFLVSLSEKLKYLQDNLYLNYHTLYLEFNRFLKPPEENLIFDQFCNQVKDDLVRLRSTRPFHVTFVGEGGIDAGGLTRESITLIYNELNDPKNGFFEMQDDGFLVPSSRCDPQKLKIIGAFIACCLLSGNPRDFNLEPKLWSLFISSNLIEKIETIDNATLRLKEGFNLILPEAYLKFFRPNEIKKLACGDSFSLEKFINCCLFYSSSFKSVFKSAISRFSTEELKRLLQFITGSSFIPFSDDFNIKIEYFYVDQYNYSSDESKWPLPVAHTCFKSIDVAPFTNPDILADKLRFAMLTEIIADGESNYSLIFS